MTLRQRAGVEHRVELRLPATRSCDGAARLVASGLGARAQLPSDRVDDLVLALELLLRERPADRDVAVVMALDRGGIELEVGPLSCADGELHRLRRLLSSLVDDLELGGAVRGTRVRIRVLGPRPALASR